MKEMDADMELTVDPADFTLLAEHHVLAVDGEPADLMALVGKVCETCWGSGREFVNGDRCQDCQGTGSELLTVVPKCRDHGVGYEGPHGLGCGCDPDGTRSLRVRLTGQPVPVVGEQLTTTFPPDTEPPYVRVNDGCAFLHSTGHDYTRIDLGPNPARLIGRWVWLPDALEVVG